MQDVDAGVQPLGLGDEALDRGVLGVARAGGEEVGVRGAGALGGGGEVVRVLGVDDEQPAEAGDLGEGAGQLLLVELGELVHARRATGST